MPFPPLGGTGSGGGFTLGPPQNVFTGATRTAAESARDTYFTANPTNLAAYNADTNLNIRLEYEASGDNIGLYQVRNTAGDTWLDNSSQVGIVGDDGTDGAATIPNAPDGTIPMVVGGALVASSAREEANEVTFGKEIHLPGGGGARLSNWDISAQGGIVGFEELASGLMYLPVASQLTADGAQRPVFEELLSVTANFEQPLTNEVFAQASDTHQFEVINANRGTATQYVLRRSAGVADATGVNIQIRLNSHTDAIPLLDYQRDHPQGATITMSAGDTTIPLPAPALFFAGVRLFITVSSSNGDNLHLIGSTLDIGGGDMQPIPAGVIAGRLSNGLVSLARLDDLPNLQTQPRLTGFTIDIARFVPVGTDLNGSHAIRYTAENVDDLTSLTLVVTDGDNVTLSVPTVDGTINDTVVISGTDTSSAGTVAMQLEGIAGTDTIQSNTYTISVQAPVQSETIYAGLSDANNPAAVDVSTLTAIQVRPGQTFTISTGATTQGQFFIVLLPQSLTVASFVDEVLEEDVTSAFTNTDNVRTINSIAYHSRVLGPLTAGANEPFTVTLGV